MKIIPIIGLLVIALLVGSWGGFLVGKQSPCAEVVQTDMWKVPPAEDQP